MLYALYQLLVQVKITFFVIFVAFTTYVMTGRQIRGMRFRARVADGRISYPLEKKDVTVVVTVFREDPDLMRPALQTMRENLDHGTRKSALIVIIDGYDKYPEDGDQAAAVARECGADFVYVTNACEKRPNIEHAFMLAERNGVLYEHFAILDSDTVCDHRNVMLELLAPFHDQMIGIVTSAQRILNPTTVAQIIADWLEFARLHSSMPGAGKKKSIGCAPGRLIAMRTELVKPLLMNRKLSQDYMRLWPSKKRIRWVAGDDRRLTWEVQMLGLGSTIALRASVKTGAPDSHFKIFNQWKRWGRSSQWYTFRFIAWLVETTWAKWGTKKKTTAGHFRVWAKKFILHMILKEPKPADTKKRLIPVMPWRIRRRPSLERRVFKQHTFVIQQYLSDFLIMLGTVTVFAMWLYSAIFGEMDVIWWQALILACISICLTVMVRQFLYLRLYPWRILLVPWFAIVMAIGQGIRLYAFATLHKAGKWGTRSGADQKDNPIIWVREHGKTENLIEYTRPQ